MAKKSSKQRTLSFRFYPQNIKDLETIQTFLQTAQPPGFSAPTQTEALRYALTVMANRINDGYYETHDPLTD